MATDALAGFHVELAQRRNHILGLGALPGTRLTGAIWLAAGLLLMWIAGMILGAVGMVQAQDIPERKAIQQGRIANGVKNGSLTPHETGNLERKEAKINRETRRDRRQNGGNLTNDQKAHIQHQQNKVSKDIYRDKHN